jgi:hypothetical protein
VQSDVTNLPFFATTVKLGKKGVEVIVAKAATVATAKSATPEETPAALEEDSSAKDERLQVSALLKKAFCLLC